LPRRALSYIGGAIDGGTVSKARHYRRQAAEYSKQALMAPAQQRHLFTLLTRSWLELAEREDVRERLGEARSFEPA
jgi:hypothetical protein